MRCEAAPSRHSWRIEDLGQIFEARWSPFVNPASAPYVDCDILRDPAEWDAL